MRRLEKRRSGQATANLCHSDQVQQGRHGPDSRSGHEDPGLSESNPASTYDKASWRTQAVTHVHDQVMWSRHAGTGNDK